MTWIPDTHGRAIRLNLINVMSLNPNLLRGNRWGRLHNWLRDNDRLLNYRWLLDNDWLLDNNWRRLRNNDRCGIIRP